MERRSGVTAATGALGPVLTKLTDLLDDWTEFAHLERWREDIQFIKSELDSMYSLLLALWDREDLRLDAACNNWMAETRMLSYSMEEAIDGIRGDDSSGLTQPEITDATSPFEGLKNQVQYLVSRCSKDWKTLAITTSELRHLPRPNVDPRSGFLHKDASELVEMDEKKYQLIRLLQEHYTVCIVGFAGKGKTTLADQVYQAIGKKFESQAFVSVSTRPNMTQLLTSLCIQVMASAISNKRKVVTNSLAGTDVLEWKRHYSPFVQAITDVLFDDIQNKKAEKILLKRMRDGEKNLVNTIWDAEKNLINKIWGFFGREVGESTQLQGTGAEDNPVWITEFLDKKRNDKTVDDYKKHLEKIISKLLEDKR